MGDKNTNIENDDLLKEALKKKLGDIIDSIPLSLEMLSITSKTGLFKLEWKEKKEDK